MGYPKFTGNSWIFITAHLKVATWVIYDDAGFLDKALDHWQQAGNYFEKANNLYDAGRLRRNITIALANNGRLSDALLYARAALRNFESYGGRAKQDEDDAKGLIAEIEGKMKG